MRIWRSHRTTASGLVVLALTVAMLPIGPATSLPPGGSFTDDDGNIHEAAIEAIAAKGITRGCNPPANTLYCPDGTVTRGQMAAFLTRALSLPATSTDFFSDDIDSVFEGDINRLAASGITKGCNPPTNDRYCPDGKVTRGQMAAFLVRAFGYTDDGGGDLFVDDDDSIFGADIDRLGTAGVTRGCNPPANDRYCPNAYVLRDQMASFLTRALGLTPITPPPVWGDDWAKIRIPTDEGGGLNAVIAVPDGFMAAGWAIQSGYNSIDRFPRVWRSPDGHNWTEHKPTFSKGEVHDVVFDGSSYLAVGCSWAPSPPGWSMVWWSPDGVNWDPLTADNALGDGCLEAATVTDSGTLVAVGYEGDLDGPAVTGVAWTRSSSGSWRRSPLPDSLMELPVEEAPFASISGVAANGTRVVVVGATGTFDVSEQFVWTTTDLSNWVRIPDAMRPPSGAVWDVAPFGSGFISVGDVHAIRDNLPCFPGASWLSTNGRTWTGPTAVTPNPGTSIVEAEPFRDGAIGVEWRAGIWFTDDGVHWDGTSLGGSEAASTAYATDVAHRGSTIVAVGHEEWGEGISDTPIVWVWPP